MPAQRRQAVTTADVAALSAVQVADAPVAKPRRIIVSQGAHDDLARQGHVVDAGTGHLLVVQSDGSVLAHDRATGQPAEGVQVVCPVVERP